MRQKALRFVAIPVGQGDAFYLETPSGSVLVDGGRAISVFPNLFVRSTGKRGVDIVICTHNDADHANGLIGFLAAGLNCREVWLPGRWLAVLPHVLNPSLGVVKALAEQAPKTAHKDFIQGMSDDTRKVFYTRNALEIYGDFLAKSRNSEEKSFSPGNEPTVSVTGGWPETLAGDLEQAVGEEPNGEFRWLWDWGFDCMPCAWFGAGPSWCRRVWEEIFVDPVSYALFFGALKAGERIRKITVAAYHRGIAVRWFEHTTASPQGGATWLHPLNARDVAYVRPLPVDKLLDFLALSTANRQSLVFWAELEDLPGVLFTADSDLNDIHLPANLSGAIVTAPHHGSQANANAYSVVATHRPGSLLPVTWVRSDGRFCGRPGRSYLSAPGRRFCTICRELHFGPKQAVRLSVIDGSWIPTRRTRPCSCRQGTAIQTP